MSRDWGIFLYLLIKVEREMEIILEDIKVVVEWIKGIVCWIFLKFVYILFEKSGCNVWLKMESM